MEDGPQKQDVPPPEKGKSGTIFGGLGVLGLLIFKFKVYIFAALKALSFLKFGLTSFLSMGITIWFYSLAFGWVFAVEFIALLLIHEMGHFIWMKALGLNPKMPIFVPG